LNKALYKLTHTHIGPCVYCYTDSIGNPVAGADVDIYKGLLKILYLGKTDSTGWVHTADDLLYVWWYRATAQAGVLFGMEHFYFDPDTNNFVYVEMREQ